jgi:hypothetical protein
MCPHARAFGAVLDILAEFMTKLGTLSTAVIGQKDEEILASFMGFLQALKQAVESAEADAEQAMRELRGETVH